jgi:glycosyltransferase involved in cell wall biosynthesis
LAESSRHSDANVAAPVILTISRLTYSDRYKGVDHLIQAMPAIREKIPGARLRVIGRGDDLPRLQKLATPLGDAVQFLGYVSDETIKSEIAAARIFALPSEREGFGLVYLEAMAQGKPCVGAHAGGAPEVIDAASGLLIPFGDVPALASACVDALTRKWSVDAIRARAAEFSYANFRNRLQSLVAR